MSFISILKRVGTILIGIEKVAEPIVETVYPPSVGVFSVLDPIFARLSPAIQAMEVQTPVGSGAFKADAVVADFEVGLELAQQILSLEGKTVTYDKAQLQAGIAAQVAAYNAFAAVKASFKIELLPAPAPVSAPVTAPGPVPISSGSN